MGYSNAHIFSLFEYAFGTALAPLKKIKNLHLGIFLSELDIFDAHVMRHSPAPGGLSFCLTHRAIGPCWEPFGPDECSVCRDKYADEVRKTELFASAAIARFMPSLKVISWSSFFASQDPGDDPDAQTTTVWIKRKDSKIRVRRMAW